MIISVLLQPPMFLHRKYSKNDDMTISMSSNSCGLRLFSLLSFAFLRGGFESKKILMQDIFSAVAA